MPSSDSDRPRQTAPAGRLARLPDGRDGSIPARAGTTIIDRSRGAYRPPGREQPAGPGGERHPVAQPVERVGLELDEGRSRQPHPGVAVDHAGDQVRQPRGIQPAARDVGEIAGARRRERPRHPLVEQSVDQGLVGDAPFGRRLAEAATEIGRVHVARAGCVSRLRTCSTSRSTVACPMRRISSALNSRSAGSVGMGRSSPARNACIGHSVGRWFRSSPPQGSVTAAARRAFPAASVAQVSCPTPAVCT